MNEALGERQPTASLPTASAVFKDGGILEMLHDPEARTTAFAYWRDGSWRIETSYKVNAVYQLVPYSPDNNLIRHQIILLPREPVEYGSEEELITEIKAFIHRYVVLSPLYEQIATYYVLFSWIYDGFNELPYLRVRGDPGTGKTRFLLTVGSLCYKPVLASGASSVSPIFRLLETFKGTLILDESDFRFSDEKAELVKILNNGNVRGFPVLRSEGNGKGEFNPHAYQVFGPKVVATRGDFDDRALESRFLTEDMGREPVRDVPLNLPPEHATESLALRNKLLFFRFRNLGRRPITPELADPTLEPRINQIFVPLLSVISDPKAREELRAVARQCQRDMISELSLSTEAQVLASIQDLLVLNADRPISIKDITNRFIELYEGDYKWKITPKWIGTIVHKRLHLKTQRTRDGYVVTSSERPKLESFFKKYGLVESAPTARNAHDSTFTSSP